MSFEASLTRLEEIVKQLDDGRTDLETALARYEEGVALLRKSHGILDTAQRKIEMLRGNAADGTPILEPVGEAKFKTDPLVYGHPQEPGPVFPATGTIGPGS